ncbi:MAG: diol dehydratase small subunit [Lentilactobacillus diolivorans]|jgi:propanediol dehydratase small subunit|uniref:Glycerol dehydratase small subunit glde n=2 Tax=Lentilactobacillus diolivorans TaxID=179838 RepID=A0A0R1RZT8_9LACO|nr:diol dehydratase small subunit [Lentilactobacillus diolivorans]RRG02472.1 MAG: propanediol dehydratase small subunit PduE [Lactobacillus sp.]KRL62461.1 glycerol dehydratase small subunit glde [Lentilactobacillus diolivorans DSM 14421]MCH4164917.1 diol dehydratase small subunit [Lentilactobacillus diolivorans]MDH5105176.1 diol dehydratase small subunit [Lentilactobacillus diolivorans]GEP24225.1 propanediol dehydratase small subunit [Lentilactobacillus diolivorans]
MSEVDELVSKILSQLNNGDSSQSTGTTTASSVTPTSSPANSGKTFDKGDYPLFRKHPDDVKTPTGKAVSDITLDNVVSGKVDSKDLRITANTLRRQGEIAASAGRPAIQRNFQRAAELTKIPDDKVLSFYNALRPFRSSKQDLLDIAKQLRDTYHAPVCANWFEEAAGNYEISKKLKGDN